MKEYDETAALGHIKQYLRDSNIAVADENLIVEAVDCIWDAYDELGLLDADFSDEFDEQKIYEQEQQERRKVIDYVARQMKGQPLDRNAIGAIFDAETEYEESLI